MTEEIYTRLIPLPMTIGAFTVLKDGVFTIIVNSNLSPEAQLREHNREMEHIRRGDFEKKCSADLIEIYAHEHVGGGT